MLSDKRTAHEPERGNDVKRARISENLDLQIKIEMQEPDVNIPQEMYCLKEEDVKHEQIKTEDMSKGEIKRKDVKIEDIKREDFETNDSKKESTKMGAGDIGNINADKRSMDVGKEWCPTCGPRKDREIVVEKLTKKAVGEAKPATKTEIDNACQAFEPKTVKESNGKWLITGMKSELFGYQLLGAGWLRSRERGLEEPRGGILADQMGFGKTVQMIANIVNDFHTGVKGKPERREAQKRMTLIVTPNQALVDQWYDEFGRHCDEENKLISKDWVVKYHAGEKGLEMRNVVKSMMDKYRVMITTYAEVIKQSPDDIPDSFEDENAERAWMKTNERRMGPIHKIRFHRIVLDEAQKIKSRKGLASKCCRALRSTHYWLLTGTPIQNSPEELYPYFDFIKVPGVTSFRAFNRDYLTVSRSGKYVELNKWLARVLLRRTDETTPINVPNGTETTVSLHFNDQEKMLYDMFQGATEETISKIVDEANRRMEEEGTVAKKIINLAMKLRRHTAHPLLMAHLISPPQNGGIQPQAQFSTENIDALLRLAHNQEPLSQTVVSGMRSYIQDLGEEYVKQQREWERRSLGTFNKKQLKHVHRQTIGSASFKYRTAIWLQHGHPLVLSTKLQAVIDQITDWLEDDPSRKIIVFTQFLEVIQVLKHSLKASRIGCKEYHGQMSNKERAISLRTFRDNVATKVLLMSLMAGGLGLNLTCASHAISIDLWWNKAQEDQAFGRIRRIGQTVETEFVRFTISDTIDERLLDMQRKKSEAIDRILKGKQALASKDLPIDDFIRLAFGKGYENVPRMDGSPDSFFATSEDEDHLSNAASDSESECCSEFGGDEDEDDD